MTDIFDIKKGIAEMYSRMSGYCERQSKMINSDEMDINPHICGYEIVTKGGKKYQLICELRERYERETYEF